MTATAQAAPAAKPSFDATMLALDAVDTLLHREKVKLGELNSDEYDDALRRTIREYLALEGKEVSDDIVEEAVGQARKERLVFVPAKSGGERTLATIYVRRGRYARRTAIAAAFFTVLSASSWLAYDFAVVRPREAEVARVETLFGATLPTELAVALTDAREGAKLANAADGAAVVGAIETRGREAIRLRDEKAARIAISDARSATNALKHEALVAIMFKTKLPRELGVAIADGREAAKLAGLPEATVKLDSVEKRGREAIRLRDEDAALQAIGDAKTLTEEFNRHGVALELGKDAQRIVALSAADKMDSRARAMIAVKLATLQAAADEGDRKRYASAKADVEIARTFVLTPYSIRIASRAGVNSYVKRLFKKSVPTFYVIVEAENPAGKPGVASIRNAESGDLENVTYWGVSVTESFYNSVKEDKRDGIVNKFAAGSKAAGTADFAWTIPVQGDQMITRW
jgi:hypothetical protein